MILPNSSLRESVIDSPNAILACSRFAERNVASLYFPILRKRRVVSIFPQLVSSHLGEHQTVARRSISGTANAIVKPEILRWERQGGSTRKRCFVLVAFCALRARISSPRKEGSALFRRSCTLGLAFVVNPINFSMAICVPLK